MKIHGGTLSVKWQKPIWKVDTLPDSSVRALLPPPPSSPCGSPPPRPESTFTSGVWSDPHHKDLRAGGAEVLSTVCRWGSYAWQLALPESHSWKQHHIFYPKAYTLVPPVQPPGPWWTLDTVVGGMGCVTTGLDVSLWTGVWKRGFWQVHSVALALSGPWTSSFLPQSLPISFSVAGIDIHSTQSAGSRCLLFIHWKHISCPSSICLEEAGQEVPINALYIPGLDSLVTEMPTCRKQKEDFFFLGRRMALKYP